MTDFKKYISSHAVSEITVGKSGARVYELDDSSVAKYVDRQALSDPGLWDAYEREARFYTEFGKSGYGFIPEVSHCHVSDDEIQLVMKKYSSLSRRDINGELLDKVMQTLSCIHALPVPGFLAAEEDQSTDILPEDISRCLSGWRSVLSEHEGKFSGEDLALVSENIEVVNRRLRVPERCCCHGDYHFDNILVDENGNIVVCDWQSVNMGHASEDISFLLSRLAADGINVKPESVVSAYCRCAKAAVDSDVILMQMKLANLNTSFLFWHEYLSDNPEERVRGIFDGMVNDMKYLLAYRVE